MSFGVAEAGVELQDLGPVLGHHEADEKGAAKVDALGRDALDAWLDDGLLDEIHGWGVDEVGGGVGAHAAGVGPGVAFEGLLVVLAGGEDDVVRARNDHMDGGFLAEEAFLDEDVLAAFAKGAAVEHVAYGLGGDVVVFGDDDALASCEAVGFDHDGERSGLEVVKSCLGAIEAGCGSGRNVVLEEQFLGVLLAGFHLGSVRLGAVGENALGEKLVHEAEGQGNFRAHNDEIDRLFGGKGDEAVDVVGSHGNALGVALHAGIARSGDNVTDEGALSAGSDESVFAAAGADDEGFEWVCLGHGGWKMVRKSKGNDV